MPSNTDVLINALEQTLRFRYVAGGHTTYTPPYQRKWRILPHAMLSHNTGSTFEIEFRNGTSLQTDPNGALFVPGGVDHRVKTTGARPVTDHWLIFNFTIYSGIDLFSFIKIPTLLPAQTGKRIGQLCHALTRLYAPNQSQTLLTTSQKLSQGHALLAILMEHATPLIDNDKDLNDLSRILPILRYIDEHKAHPITRNDLADQINLSPVRLHTLFKSVMHVAPMTYLKQVRLRDAQTRLVTTSQPIAQISQSVGYPDPFHFSRLFKSEFGLSPLQYRKQIGQMG